MVSSNYRAIILLSLLGKVTGMLSLWRLEVTALLFADVVVLLAPLTVDMSILLLRMKQLG